MAAGDGLISMTPTSIAHSGTSASINSDGGVDFTAVTSLSLNGVFTSDYDNYLVVLRHNGASGSFDIDCRLRVSGSDNSTANSYVRQLLDADGATTPAGRLTSNIWSAWSGASATQRDGATIHFYGPALAQPTAFRSVCALGVSSAYVRDCAGTHNQSTAYDGFTISPTSSSISGVIHVFGYEE